MPAEDRGGGGLEALADALRAKPPVGLAAVLSESELQALAEAIRDARRRQAEALRQAGEEALGRLPRLVRIAVRTVGGG
jgi:hypothetical protein